VGGAGSGRGHGGGRAPSVAAATKATSSSLGGASDPVPIKSKFTQNMGQQLGAANQGMFPMMNPNMWNMPMSKWQ
jgi:hypothetical protein